MGRESSARLVRSEPASAPLAAVEPLAEAERPHTPPVEREAPETLRKPRTSSVPKVNAYELTAAEKTAFWTGRWIA